MAQSTVGKEHSGTLPCADDCLHLRCSCPVQIQEALSSSPAGTAELDLVCAYMKRVHLYLYYRGQQCRDEGDMISSRSACRGTEAASKEDVQEVSDVRFLAFLT